MNKENAAILGELLANITFIFFIGLLILFMLYASIVLIEKIKEKLQ